MRHGAGYRGLHRPNEGRALVCTWRDLLKHVKNSRHSQIYTAVTYITLVTVCRVVLREINPEAFLMLQRDMIKAWIWVIVESGKGKAIKKE